jgi:hypothetical protein
MKITSKFAAVAVCAYLLTGCVNIATSKVEPGTDLTSLKTMYVKQIPADKRGVNEIVADKLRSKGVKVKTGIDDPTGPVDALVTYADKWMWDITMYMLDLTIVIRDPKDQMPLASGYSKHTSLTRKSPQEMVDEVIDNIYKDAGSK